MSDKLIDLRERALGWGLAEPDALQLIEEVERLRAELSEAGVALGQSGVYIERTRAENERLRAALSEMLESFTEPEDDNDILQRARAALARHKDG